MRKQLFLLVLSGLTVTACAPQRTTFTGAKQAVSKPSSPTPSSQSTIAPPDELTVQMNSDQQASLHQLIEALDTASGKTLEQGSYRVFREEQDKVGEPLATYRQEIVRVDGAAAMSETFKLGDSPESSNKRSSKLKEMDPIEKAVRFLEAGNNQELYRILALYLVLKLGKALPEKPHATIDVRSVGFLEQDSSLYGITLALKIREIPRTFVFETRFAPGIPRPFNVVYQAYGMGVERPGGAKVRANRVYRQVIEYKPAENTRPEPDGNTCLPE